MEKKNVEIYFINTCPTRKTYITKRFSRYHTDFIKQQENENGK